MYGCRQLSDQSESSKLDAILIEAVFMGWASFRAEQHAMLVEPGQKVTDTYQTKEDEQPRIRFWHRRVVRRRTGTEVDERVRDVIPFFSVLPTLSDCRGALGLQSHVIISLV